MVASVALSPSAPSSSSTAPRSVMSPLVAAREMLLGGGGDADADCNDELSRSSFNSSHSSHDGNNDSNNDSSSSSEALHTQSVVLSIYRGPVILRVTLNEPGGARLSRVLIPAQTLSAFLSPFHISPINEFESTSKTQTIDGAESNGKTENNAQNKATSAIFGSINGALGGGEKGENKENYLDKATDIVQEYALKAGDQSNESAIEQAKDAQVARAIRTGCKTVTGNDFPIAEKTL
ncbi:hypothetical protein CVT25_002011 [Psilocybe cyanescens]|uniref:Uncharacterized protein n=1 Tax=Psilocybe cyanescens TaxID=93625 RepID=A0A409XF02_PSICY|nr:hypothetical protein CVT25_002011 [Psilocybe cyanescens]